MKTILVDGELLMMERFAEECREVGEIELVGKFNNAEDALRYAGNHRVEFALIDICLPGMDGIELGHALKRINPDIILIYVTSYSGYVVETMKMKADYCIMEPCEKSDITDALIRAKLLSKRFQKRLQVVTFGRFEVYVDDKPLYFSNSKSKELFAYCIHREGAMVTMEEAIDILWPDRPYDERVKRLYRKAVGAIQNAMEECGLQDVFVSNRGSCHIERRNVNCDLYHLLEGDIPLRQQENMIRGGYLTDYSWAEFRNVSLTEEFQQKNCR